MQVTKTQLSEAYRQLSGLFESLEKARFELDKDFGVNALDCSGWYISPPAVIFLEKRLNPCSYTINTISILKTGSRKFGRILEQGINIKFNIG
ncbi:hypothetical protein [Nostoc sp.]